MEADQQTIAHKTSDYKPTIVGFLCNWCSYAGADLAGVSRMQMPTTLRVIRVMCSGSLDPNFPLSALKAGADGVLIMGCHPGDCHYISGNYEAYRKYRMLKKLLKFIDMEDERLHLEWVSASEGARFQQVVTEFTSMISDIGPNPIRKNDQKSKKMKEQLDAAIHATQGFRLRSLFGREKKITELGNAYGERLTKDEIERVEDEIIEDEFIRSNIILRVEEEPKTVEEIASGTGFSPEIIFKHVARLWKKQIILPHGHKDLSPTYLKAGGA